MPKKLSNGSDEAFDSSYYCVEASNDSNTEKAVIEKFFDDYDSAGSFADRMSERYLCVWLSERGEYENLNGHTRETWIYFWWTEKTNVGDLPDYGEGYPQDRANLVSYKPLAPDRKPVPK